MEPVLSNGTSWNDYSIQDRRDYVEHLYGRWDNFFTEMLNEHIECPVLRNRREAFSHILQGVFTGFHYGDCGKFSENGDSKFPILTPSQNDLGQVFIAALFVANGLSIQYFRDDIDEDGNFKFDLMEVEVTAFILQSLIEKHGSSEVRAYVESSKNLHSAYTQTNSCSYDALRHLMMEGEC